MPKPADDSPPPLTDRQREIYEWYLAECGKPSGPPTFRRMALHFRVSTQAVYTLFGRLRDLGYVSLDQKRTTGPYVSAARDPSGKPLRKSLRNSAARKHD